jgi:hypothetical protein
LSFTAALSHILVSISPVSSHILALCSDHPVRS